MAAQDANSTRSSSRSTRAPSEPQDDGTAQLQNLANLHAQGVLTPTTSSLAAKAKILGIVLDRTRLACAAGAHGLLHRDAGRAGLLSATGHGTDVR